MAAPDKSDSELFAAILRKELYSFVKTAFEYMEGATLRPSEHIELICLTLAGALDKECLLGEGSRRLIINLPPRTLKSFIVSVCFVAWTLGRDPGSRIMLITHDQKLAESLADQCKRIMRSDWYARIFPRVRIRDDFSKVENFKTTNGGELLATSIGSGLTGHGADIIIIDDPLDAGNSSSETERRRVNQLFDEKIRSRLNNQSTGQIILVAQRLHLDDLCGHLERSGGFTHLKIPLVAETDTAYQVGDWRWDRPAGHVLDAQSYSPEEVGRLRKLAYVFQAQYQQVPIRIGCGIVKPDWFSRHDAIPESARETVLSWDFGQALGEKASFTCCLVFRTDGLNHYLVDVCRIKAEFTVLMDQAMKRIDIHKPCTTLIENAALGIAVISALKSKGNIPVEIDRPTRSKMERLEANLDVLSAGRVSLPRQQVWVERFLEEICQFPVGEFDDQVDALTQYLSWIKNPNRRRHEPCIAKGSGSIYGTSVRKPHFMRNPAGLPRMQYPYR